MSGYPSRAESEHDLVENSHASTAVSYAYGLAVARDAAGDDNAVVAVIGDGALTGGLAYEALNNFGATGRRAVIVLNDNGRCYAPTVSRLTVAGHASGETGDPAAFFTALGLDYVGPVDGHDVAALEPVLRDAATRDRPVVVHVLTHKGEGYLPAEADDEKRLHDIGAFDPETGVPVGANGSSYTAAFRDALIALAEERPEIVAITAGMPGSTGLLPFAERFPDRCFDVGIAEQHAVTAAAGMAMRGLRPVVAIYSTFLSRAWDQMVYDVGLHGLPVVFCLDRAGITGDDGPSHHGLYDLALLTKVPGLTLFAPSSYEEMTVMLEEALRITSGPVALRWPKTVARHVMPGAVGSGRSARACACRRRRVHPRAREDGRGGGGSRRAARHARRARDGVGHPHHPRRPEDARRRAASSARRHRRGRHRRGRGGRAPRGPARCDWRRARRRRPSSRWARPRRSSRTASPPRSSPTSASTAPASRPRSPSSSKTAESLRRIGQVNSSARNYPVTARRS